MAIMSNEEDNIEAAMEKLAETLEPTRKTNTGSTPGEPAMKQVIVRATEYDHDRWKLTAERQGVSLAEFVRRLCNEAAAYEIDCPHPIEFRQSYPWSERCTKCNVRLR